MSRSEPRASSPLRTLLLLVGLNALPLGGAAYVLLLRQRGEVEVKALPDESRGLLVLMGVALVAIVMLGWVAFPALRDLRTAARRRARGPLSFLWSGLAGLLLLDLGVLAIAVLLTFGLELVLIVRFALSLHGQGG
jgi:hypothetical protein